MGTTGVGGWGTTGVGGAGTTGVGGWGTTSVGGVGYHWGGRGSCMIHDECMHDLCCMNGFASC